VNCGISEYIFFLVKFKVRQETTHSIFFLRNYTYNYNEIYIYLSLSLSLSLYIYIYMCVCVCVCISWVHPLQNWFFLHSLLHYQLIFFQIRVRRCMPAAKTLWWSTLCFSSLCQRNGVLVVHASWGLKDGSQRLLNQDCRADEGFIQLDSFFWSPETIEFDFFNILNVCTHSSVFTVAPLFKNSTNQGPSLSQKMLAITLSAKVYTLNLFIIFSYAWRALFPFSTFMSLALESSIL
jgi:hypothetical protein